MIFSPKNPVVRCMVKLFYLVLGQIVSVSNEDKLCSNCVIVANKVSSLEGIFLSLTKGYQVAVIGNAGFFESNFFNFVSLSSNSNVREKQFIEMKDKKTPIIVFPEAMSTNNACLLPFSEWTFKTEEKVQPMTIEIIRPQPINICHLQSHCVVDLFWSFFSFFTYYDVIVPKPLKREDFENIHLYKEAETTIFQNKKTSRTDWSSEINLIKSVIPSAERKVILSDLEKSNCLHKTIVNFFEEKVTNHNAKVTKKETYVKNPEERHMSLQEKKLSFVERAKNEYISKFSLKYR